MSGWSTIRKLTKRVPRLLLCSAPQWRIWVRSILGGTNDSSASSWVSMTALSASVTTHVTSDWNPSQNTQIPLCWSLAGGGAAPGLARWNSHICRVKPLVDFTMVGYTRMQPQGSLARVLVHTSPMVNSSVQKEGHTLDFVTQRVSFGAKSSKSRFEVATLHRNVDYRVSATQFGGKEPKWVQLIAGDPPYADQRLHPAYSLSLISASGMGGGGHAPPPPSRAEQNLFITD